MCIPTADHVEVDGVVICGVVGVRKEGDGTLSYGIRECGMDVRYGMALSFRIGTRQGRHVKGGRGTMSNNSSPLGLLTVPNPRGSSYVQTKQPKSLGQMVELMRDRGLAVENERELESALFDCNYYRLSGYFRVFQEDPAHGVNKFHTGVRVDDFIHPYRMDSRLRELILHGTALIELTLRSRFAYLAAMHGGAYTYANLSAYQDRRNRTGVEMREGLLTNIGKWVSMSSEVCIRHYRKRGAEIPIWAAVEVLPFDTVSRMLSLYSDTAVLRELYRSFNIRTNLRTASEIVHAMVYLRNLCSHHSRLWHREMVIASPVTKDMRSSYPDFDYEEKSVAGSLMALMYLVDSINGDNAYSRSVLDLIHERDDYLDGIVHPLHWE